VRERVVTVRQAGALSRFAGGQASAS
jgi:hypothetical protein